MTYKSQISSNYILTFCCEMILVVLVAILRICDCRHASPEVKSPPRSVNLALETAFEFGHNDNSADLQMIDKVQSFLKRVKNEIKKKKDYRRSNNVAPPTFTNFIKDAIIILNGYNDGDLEDLITIAEDEIRKYHYRGCKFYELIDNPDLRRFVADKLDHIRTVSASKIRKKMNILLDKLQDDDLGLKYKLISKYIDSLYSPDDAYKLANVLDNLSIYKRKTQRSSLDLIKIVRNGIRSVIFDHYSNLDNDTRKDLKSRLDSLWDDFNRMDKFQHHAQDIKLFTRIDFDDSGTKHKKYGRFRSRERTKRYKLRKKRKPFVLADSIQRDLNRMKKTWKQKMTFITLYPESLTKRRKKHKKSKKIDPRNDRERKRSTKFESDLSVEFVRRTTKSKTTRERRPPDFDNEYFKPITKKKKMRYVVVARRPEKKEKRVEHSDNDHEDHDDHSSASSSIMEAYVAKKRKRLGRGGRKRNYYSSEGISIEIPLQSGRKSNDIVNGTFDTLVVEPSKIKLPVDIAEEVITTNSPSPVDKNKIGQSNETSTQKRFDELFYWESTKANEQEDTTLASQNLTAKTMGTNASTIELSTTLATKTQHELKELNKIDDVVTPSNPNKPVDVTDKKEMLEITTEYVDVKLQNRYKTIDNLHEMVLNLSNSVVPFLSPIANETQFRKNIEIPDSKENSLERGLDIAEINEYLNETKTADDKDERVRQQILRDIMPELNDQDLVSTTGNAIPTMRSNLIVDVKDPLAIIDEGDDIDGFP